MTSADLLQRTRERCSQHRFVPGVCRHCLLWEFEAMVREENPELSREEARELVQEWLRAVDEPAH